MAIVSNAPSADEDRSSSRPDFFPVALRALLLAAPVFAIVAAGIDHRWMDDDGFINLRVVRNLLEGHGPVFNVGERVEAVTSPLWVGILAVLGGVGLRLENAAVYAGITLAGAGVLLAEIGAARLHGSRESGATLVIPFGAVLFVALPPAWDYASAGLEVGLTLAWLGAAFLATARAATGGYEGTHGARRIGVDSVLVGLGPLVRPELALHAVAPLGFLAVAAWRSSPASKRAGAVAALRVLAIGAALPLAYQIFRMGYFASATPNTAIAKEALLTNFKQGACYFDNFAGTYRLGWPFGVAAVVWLAVSAARAAGRQWLAFGASVAPVCAAAIHACYVVRMGGDYMHGRMLLAPAFAALMPVAVIPLRAREGWVRIATVAAVYAAALPWVGLCATRLRMGVDNVCDVGDERGWYARSAKTDHPVVVDDYREHTFYADGLAAMKRTFEECPRLSSPQRMGSAAGCRLLHLSEDEEKEVAARSHALPLATDVDPRLGAVVSAGAIGIVGELLPDTVHVLDRLGLADPLVARRLLETRARPGHEKSLPAAWMVARFAEPEAGEDGAVVAARHALRCGSLDALVRAVTGKLDASRFVDNFVHALELSRLRIPADPFEAETALCGTPPLRTTAAAGGGGGSPFHVRCPETTRAVGLRGNYAKGDQAVSRVQLLCIGRGSQPSAAPPEGDGAGEAFDLACPPGEDLVGLRAGADNLVRAVSLVCGRGADDEMLAIGGGGGVPTRLACPPDEVLVGLVGRSGVLVDQVRAECR